MMQVSKNKENEWDISRLLSFTIAFQLQIECANILLQERTLSQGLCLYYPGKILFFLDAALSALLQPGCSFHSPLKELVSISEPRLATHCFHSWFLTKKIQAGFLGPRKSLIFAVWRTDLPQNSNRYLAISADLTASPIVGCPTHY